ncbi:MAG: hypothetical protein ACI9XK_004193, partial [Granulosicoccus sp.]
MTMPCSVSCSRVAERAGSPVFMKFELLTCLFAFTDFYV